MWSTGQLSFREPWSTGHLLSDIVVVGKVEGGLHRVAAYLLATVSLSYGYKLFLSTMSYSVYTSSPINSASSLSSSSVKLSGASV